MWVPTVLFLLFAVLSAAGVYLIVAHHGSRRVALLGALATLLLYVAIYAGVLYLIRPLEPVALRTPSALDRDG